MRIVFQLQSRPLLQLDSGKLQGIIKWLPQLFNIDHRVQPTTHVAMQGQLLENPKKNPRELIHISENNVRSFQNRNETFRSQDQRPRGRLHQLQQCR